MIGYHLVMDRHVYENTIPYLHIFCIKCINVTPFFKKCKNTAPHFISEEIQIYLFGEWPLTNQKNERFHVLFGEMEC